MTIKRANGAVHVLLKNEALCAAFQHNPMFSERNRLDSYQAIAAFKCKNQTTVQSSGLEKRTQVFLFQLPRSGKPKGMEDLQKGKMESSEGMSSQASQPPSSACLLSFPNKNISTSAVQTSRLRWLWSQQKLTGKTCVPTRERARHTAALTTSTRFCMLPRLRCSNTPTLGTRHTEREKCCTIRSNQSLLKQPIHT